MSHYISNKEFTEAIVAYLEECTDRESRGLEANPIPDTIARQFIALATNLSNRYNFVRYTFKADMVSSAIYACCAKVRKFNPLIGSNAFAYYTNVCWRAMVDVINYEEKMSYIKAKAHQFVDPTDALAENDLSDYSEHTEGGADFVPYFDVAEFEKKMADQKERSKAAAKKPNPNLIELDIE